MTSNIESSNPVLKCIDESLNDYNGLYSDIPISTTTITCAINLIFDTENIGKYFDDFDDFLVGKRYGNRLSSNIIDTCQTTVSKRVFNNQVSFMFVSNNKKINVKLFTNGSIHMTGCGNFMNAKMCLISLCDKLKKRKAIFDGEKFKEIKFVTSLDDDNDEITINTISNELKLENIYNFNIRMINICFNQDMCINRKVLNELLRSNGIESMFNQINASVNIKYMVNDTKITIFVFHSGLVTIAGTKSVEYLMEAYWFINHFLLTNYNLVFTKKITPSTILDLLQNLKEKEEKEETEKRTNLKCETVC